MSNKERRPIDFIKEPKDWIEAITGLVVAVSSFIALFENYRYSLVFVILGILIGVSVHFGFSTSMSPFQEGRRIPRFPRWRVPARVGVVIFPVLLLGSMSYAQHQYIDSPSSSSGTSLSSSLPLVILMDSAVPKQVYNPETQALGGTNGDDISDILKGLPEKLKIIKETTNLQWNREDDVLSQNPDLIIIHASCFYDETNVEDSERKFDSFIRYMKHSHTKFLIYTRGGTDEDNIKEYYELTYPFLKGRLDVMRIEGGASARWNETTGRELKIRVKSLLGLD